MRAAYTHIAQVTIYVSDIETWTQLNTVYNEMFGDHKPARCVVPTPPLHYGAGLELEAIASLQ